jgi:hypothetical protein
LRPTWVAFTPWTTLEDYLEVLQFVEAHGLIDHVDPVQYTIRLLVPPGSYLLDRAAMTPHLGPLDQAAFTYRWRHPDPRMDRLHRQVSALVEQDARDSADPGATFYRIWALAAETRGWGSRRDLERRFARRLSLLRPGRKRAPRLTEPWFC